MKSLFIATTFFVLLCWSCEGPNKKSQSNAERNKNSDTSTLRDTNQTEVKVDYANLGKDIVNNAQAVLSQNLIIAVQEKGAAGAVEFCNEKAYPLTDSVAKIHNATIKRVSDQPRNPKNKAVGEEVSMINKMKKLLSQDEKLHPIIKESNGKIQAYYPIITNSLCLKCHGKVREDVLLETFSKIKSLYPDDKATGYSENQLRGLWVLEMDKNN